ncbi:MAG: TolC family protein, partial [Spirochaetaceae bacterium]
MLLNDITHALVGAVYQEVLPVVEYSRVRQTLVADVIRAWWRVAMLQEAWNEAQELIARATDRRERLQQQIERRQGSETRALELETRLLQTELRLGMVESQHADARSELARLIGADPGMGVNVTPVGDPPAPAAPLPVNHLELEREALRNRPELFERDFQEHIAADEVRAAIIQMFPSLGGFFRQETDRNRYLWHNTWHSTGLTVAWDLLSLPQKYSQVRSNRQRLKLQERRRLSMAIGVVSQLHIAYNAYEEAVRQVRLNERVEAAQRRLVEVFRKRLQQGDVDEDAVYSGEVEAFL